MTPKRQTLTKHIVVDQFGYLPSSKKIAVIRDPQTGFDASESFTPGTQYALIDKSTGNAVFTAAPIAWKSGATDISSGDKVWWFDFSSTTTAGTYYVLDVEKNLRSFEFEISPAIYNGLVATRCSNIFLSTRWFCERRQVCGSCLG